MPNKRKHRRVRIVDLTMLQELQDQAHDEAWAIENEARRLTAAAIGHAMERARRPAWGTPEWEEEVDLREFERAFAVPPNEEVARLVAEVLERAQRRARRSRHPRTR